MTFGKSGRFYIVTRHNSFLAVELDNSGLADEPVVIPLPAIYNFGNKLNPERVVIEVLKGVDEANQLFRTNYSVREIHYVEDDTPPESFYGDMVKKLIQRLESGENVKHYQHGYKYADS